MFDKILVTGGNGYIGSHIINYCKELNYVVHSLDITDDSKNNVEKYYSVDITNFNDLKKINDPYDIIFHCAGSASVPRSVKNPMLDFKINFQGTLNMLECVRNTNSGTFVFLSTVSVFDSHNELPITETSIKKPTSPYGAGKLSGENYCQSYFRTYGVDARIARIFNTFGPGMPQLFIADMMKKIRNANDKIVINGSGKQIRDYMYITDVVRALVTIAKKGQPGEDYNICTGKAITLYEVTRILLDKMKKNNLDIVCNGKSYPGDIEKWYGEPKKLNNMGFKPVTELEKGIEETIKLQIGL